MNRIEKIQKQLTKNNVDAILITKNENRRYTTGFTGSAGMVLISQKGVTFITDFRYGEQAQAEVKNAKIVIHDGNIEKEVASEIERHGIQNLAVEANAMTLNTFSALKEYTNAQLVPLENIVEKVREIKDQSELETMRTAARIADTAFDNILNVIKPGITEREVRNELEVYMRKQGASSSSFNIIVASGQRAALPHGVASEKVIEHGDMVTLDFGAMYNGYCSDITRTIAVGNCSDEFHDIYHIVLEALKRGTEGIRAGENAKKIDDLTRDYITEKGYGDRFGHSTGHGLGLEVHEPLRLSDKSKEVLQAGMVVTVEPGIYIPGWGGCRIEDDIVVTENGYEIITHSPKKLLIL
ncbi:aminopeptidase P family protein [Bacillus sp. RG28]|uniref:Aminopeptidase P family protein n=1 Tax=Gottfriedia endophytica TaxID=2820819 RepID=A0A940NRN7_9BACI|nr:Xaa-Pro peptidase family protein [Gottfriedia endophytica]MBP0725767.1 aminopeptidase P family protein [Gottfriedia endophytica]